MSNKYCIIWRLEQNLFKKFKHDTLDTLIVVGDNGLPSHTELFTLSSSKWQIKKGYPYSKNIYQYSILTVEKNFIIFGGHQNKMKVLNNQEKVMRTLLRYNSFNTVVKANKLYALASSSLDKLDLKSLNLISLERFHKYLKNGVQKFRSKICFWSN